MHVSVSSQKRPNKNVEFWVNKGTTAYTDYVRKNFVETGKLKKLETVMSDDELTLITTVYWSEEKHYLEFRTDDFIIKEYVNPFNEYASATGIVLSSTDSKNNMVVIQGPDPYPNLVIPESWNSVEEFADWWLRSGMPMIFQSQTEVFLSDDATAISLFRKGRFQVELYLIHPNPMVPNHEHPDVEVIKIRLDGKKYPYLSTTLHNGEAHGAGLRQEAEERGYPLIAIQHWLTREPTTVASMWKGKTVGPKQEALIKRFNPDAYVIEGYADITKSV